MKKIQHWVVAFSDEDWFEVDECSFHLLDNKNFKEICERGYINFPEPQYKNEDWVDNFIHSMDGEEVSELLPTSDSKASFYETKMKSY
jgi:hypothetical protein